MASGPVYGVALGVALVALLLFAIVVATIGRLPVRRELIVAAVRASIQLLAVSAFIAAIMGHTWSALLFAFMMFAVAVFTAGGRIGARRDWLWIGVALGAGVAPVLAVIFGSGVAGFTGPAIIPIAGIITGGAMTAHTLTGRRAFDAIRSDRGQIEAALALGLTRPRAVALVIGRHAPEALTPVLDQTRTVGLVTLPGAFVGVLLGGGSASEAAASQVLVLVGLLAAETAVVVASHRLIAAGRILPIDIRASLPQ